MEALCPSLGQRTFRAKFDFVEHIERSKTAEGIRHRYVARFMTWPEYHKFAKDTAGLEEQYITAEWTMMERTPEWPRDDKGKPNGSRRYLVHMFDEVEGYFDQEK